MHRQSMWKITKEKLTRRIRGKFVRTIKHLSWRQWLYRSWWHYVLHPNNPSKDRTNLYYSSYPNPGAGIGHQITNWAAGIHYANTFHLNKAYIPFADKQWEKLLGFGYGAVTLKELRAKRWNVRRLPLITDDNPDDIALCQRIIQSYAGKKVVFLAELDQFYNNLPELQPLMREKFYEAEKKRELSLIYHPDQFNIAIHVRRGDIMLNPEHPGLKIRFLANDYYDKVLSTVLETFKSEKPIHIYFFSQGQPEDYPEFAKYNHLHWCLDMNPYDSFLHMVHADMLITSKSSFSYKPALISNGIRVCPRLFWHPYPSDGNWILAENDGSIMPEEIIKLKHNSQLT